MSSSDSTSDFKLQRQPKTKQRKSYASENRYIAPNPVTVQHIESIEIGHSLIAGQVEVTLATKDGERLLSMQDTDLAGVKIASIDQNGCAEFQLKMTTTFSGEPVRLLFIITYTRLDHPDEGPQTTELLSFPFRVDTNVRRRAGADRRLRAANATGNATPLKSPRRRRSSSAARDTQSYAKGLRRASDQSSWSERLDTPPSLERLTIRSADASEDSATSQRAASSSSDMLDSLAALAEMARRCSEDDNRDDAV